MNFPFNRIEWDIYRVQELFLAMDRNRHVPFHNKCPDSAPCVFHSYYPCLLSEQNCGPIKQ